MTLGQLQEVRADCAALAANAVEKFLDDHKWTKTMAGLWFKRIDTNPIVTSAEMAVLIETDELESKYTVDAEYF